MFFRKSSVPAQWSKPGHASLKRKNCKGCYSRTPQSLRDSSSLSKEEHLSFFVKIQLEIKRKQLK